MTTEINAGTYLEIAGPHLEKVIQENRSVIEKVSKQLIKDVSAGRKLLVFGSGHSCILPMEVYHRAGGPSFVIPLVADFLTPFAGPPVVRVFERTAGSANFLLDRAQVQKGEMIWLCSQSGINGAVVDLALEAKKRGLFAVAFTSRAHSSSVKSRHPSGKRLFEICDEVLDLGGVAGDAAIEVSEGVRSGPLSSLTAIALAHSVLLPTLSALEKSGKRCTYTSVNTPEGEDRNRKIEAEAAVRDYLLR